MYYENWTLLSELYWQLPSFQRMGKRRSDLPTKQNAAKQQNDLQRATSLRRRRRRPWWSSGPEKSSGNAKCCHSNLDGMFKVALFVLYHYFWRSNTTVWLQIPNTIMECFSSD